MFTNNQLRAIIKLVISCMPATGAQILSTLLGVIVFIKVPMAKNTTTTHIAMFENEIISGKSKLAFDKTIASINSSMNMLIIATNFILGGYFPGNFPPIEAAPQGIPAANKA